MIPNLTEMPMTADPESLAKAQSSVKVADLSVIANKQENYKLRIFNSTLNLVAQIFIGVVVGVSLIFAFRSGLPLGAMPLHIVLCVIGYHLLMAEGILSLSSHNGWSSKLRLVDKHRAHWVLQLLGSGLGLTGCFIKILDNNVHWETLHGQFALVSMVFTAVSLVNGVTSLYAYEFRGVLNGTFSKISHMFFGIVAFVAATISLAYGFDKDYFKNWASPQCAYTLMAFAAAFTCIIIITPFNTFFDKFTNTLKRDL